MSGNTARLINWVEQGLVPDSVVRSGIRRLLRQRLKDIGADHLEESSRGKQDFIQQIRQSSIAIATQEANQQHYELLPQFFLQTLGKHHKYSCAYWPEDCQSLDQAEEESLKITVDRAKIKNSQTILELGCGWGSLTLYMAHRFPDSQIVAVSNSQQQKETIEGKLIQHGLDNVDVIKCDMNDFTTEHRFDRIVSIEMFEHMRNWPELFSQVNQWLKPHGLFFMHVFSHITTPYPFDIKDDSDWMSRYFFTGGMMPCDDLALYFQDHLKIKSDWTWDGTHYQKTSEAWLKNMDANETLLKSLFRQTYGEEELQNWWMRWRLFFMAVAELFGYEQGQQWHVKHYLFEKRNHDQ